MRRIAVIGSGITGLAAAWRLRDRAAAGTPVEVVVYEQSGRAGGVIQTDRTWGVPLEGGPDSLLVRKPHAIELARAVGLGDHLIVTHPAARGADIYWRGRLHPIPPGLVAGVPRDLTALRRSTILGPYDKLRLLVDRLMRPPRRPVADVSLGQLLARHFGAGLVDRLAAPMLSGIYAGDIRQLSTRATYPQVLDWWMRYGSLLKARAAEPTPSAPRGPVFMTLDQGLQLLTDTLAERLTPDLRLQTPVAAVEPDGSRYRVVTAGGEEAYDGVVVAVPAGRAATLLETADPAAAALLRTIPYAGLAVVGLVFDPDAVRLPAGKTGLLVPASQPVGMTAVTYVSQKWQYPTPLPYVPIRVFYGRSGDVRDLDRDDDTLVAKAVEELSRVAEVRGEPRLARVFRHDPGMPQYTVGHVDRVEALQRVLAAHPPLRVAGAAYRGVGIPDCVRDGTDAADAVLEALDVPRPA